MNAVREYFTAADTEVGQMIEGHYGWNEWCPTHATEHLMRGTSVGVNHRSIDVHEVLTSWRDYKCYQCGQLLWNKAQPDSEQKPKPKDPFLGPRSGSIVKSEYGQDHGM